MSRCLDTVVLNALVKLSGGEMKRVFQAVTSKWSRPLCDPLSCVFCSMMKLLWSASQALPCSRQAGTPRPHHFCLPRSYLLVLLTCLTLPESFSLQGQFSLFCFFVYSILGNRSLCHDVYVWFYSKYAQPERARSSSLQDVS